MLLLPLCRTDSMACWPSCRPVQAQCRSDSDCTDGNLCTHDTCQNGVCVNTPVNCDDGNACTVDTCDPVRGDCVHAAIDCDDRNACTVDSCDLESGVCVHTPVTCTALDQCHEAGVCDPASGCPNPEKQNGASCGIACIIGATCQAGVCTGGTQRNCDDFNACTTDTCDPVDGNCKHAAYNCGDGYVCYNGCGGHACVPVCRRA